MNDYSYTPKSDRRAFIFLLSVFVLSVILFFAIGNGEEATPDDVDTSFSAPHYAKRYRHYDAKRHAYIYDEGTATPTELFAFDPNTADSTTLLRLGLAPWSVRSIYRFRAKHGVFRKAEDFARVYGLTMEQYRLLKPYIRISGDYRNASEVIAQGYGHGDTVHHTRKLTAGERIYIDIADTTQLKRVPGIGSYFASRIVGYRSRLGGFHSVSQLSEIENFPKESLAYLDVSGEHIRKLKINSASLADLRHHPYLRFIQAKAIVDYVKMKGRIRSAAQLSGIKYFSKEDIDRLAPYLDFE